MAYNHLFFLESELGQSSPDQSLFHIIPAPLEQSVSYGPGTAKGPLAIIQASQQLELFDGYSNPWESGIFTHSKINCHQDIKNVLSDIQNKVSEAFSQKKIPIVIGGEHTVSLGAFRAIAESDRNIGIIHFDAHGDLRDSYENNEFSHACVMKRAFDLNIPFIQLGVRSLSPEEHDFRTTNNILHYDAEKIMTKGLPDSFIPKDFPKEVYITFDVDVLDTSIMPATGTPEPGGLLWYDAMKLLEHISAKRNIIGFDVVEFAPIENFHACDFTVARLVYNIMGFVQRSK